MPVRFAEKKDLERVNVLRRQVNDLHVAGKPDVFKPGFPKGLQNYIDTVWKDPRQTIVVNERDGVICGFAVLHHMTKPESPYTYGKEYLDIDEFGVDETCRRQGVAAEMVDFIKEYAKEKGFQKIELNMWEFNQNALAFYKAMGFATYRRYMELDVGKEELS